MHQDASSWGMFHGAPTRGRCCCFTRRQPVLTHKRLERVSNSSTSSHALPQPRKQMTYLLYSVSSQASHRGAKVILGQCKKITVVYDKEQQPKAPSEVMNGLFEKEPGVSEPKHVKRVSVTKQTPLLLRGPGVPHAAPPSPSPRKWDPNRGHLPPSDGTHIHTSGGRREEPPG